MGKRGEEGMGGEGRECALQISTGAPLPHFLIPGVAPDTKHYVGSMRV